MATDDFGDVMPTKDNKPDKSFKGAHTNENQPIIDLFALLLEWHIEAEKNKKDANQK